MIYSGVCLVSLYFLVPETNGQVLLRWKARELRKADPVANKDVYAEQEQGDWSPKGVISRTLSRPVEMLLKEKILVLVTIYLSFVYGVFYARECLRIPSILCRVELPAPKCSRLCHMFLLRSETFLPKILGWSTLVCFALSQDAQI